MQLTNLARSYNLDLVKLSKNVQKTFIFLINKHMKIIHLVILSYQGITIKIINLAEIKINNKPSSDIIKN